MDERWADIPGYAGLYQASSEGRIRRNDGVRPVRILRLMNHPNGYYQVTLSKDGKTKKMLVHRLVAAAFKGEADAVVNHIDGIKRHNQDTNLEWVTQGANMEHYQKLRARREFVSNIRAHQDDPIDF